MCGSCKSLTQARLLWWTLQKLSQWPERLRRGAWHEAIHFQRGLCRGSNLIIMALRRYKRGIFLFKKIMQVCGP